MKTARGKNMTVITGVRDGGHDSQSWLSVLICVTALRSAKTPASDEGHCASAYFDLGLSSTLNSRGEQRDNGKVLSRGDSAARDFSGSR